MYGGSEFKNGRFNVLKDSFIFSLSTNKKTGEETGLWTKTKDGPSARYLHAMSSLGNGRVILYGGRDANDNVLDDVWMYHGGNLQERLATWSPLENAMFKRSGHAMAPLITSNTAVTIEKIVMFGGQIDPVRSPQKETTNGLWTMSTGCPPGSHGNSCDLCLEDQWKGTTTNETTSCTPCPSNTTTKIRGATSKDQCMFCANYHISSHPNAVCSVDAGNSSKPNWHCFGSFGSQCEFPCPGPAKLPCNGDGKCNDGTTGNGTCTCNPGFYGSSCSGMCDCNLDGGTCSQGASGDGTCTCNPMYSLSDSKCRVPGTGILIAVAATFVFVLIVYGASLKIRKNNERNEEEMYEIYEDHNVEMSVMNVAYDNVVEDRSKLQNAWIVQFTDVQLDAVIGQGAFGDVYRGRWRGLQVAVKKLFPDEMMELGNNMSTSNSNSNQMNEVSRAMLENLEVGVMMRLRHPRIVTFLGAGEIIDPPMEGDDVPRVGIFVMLEYAAGGDLTHRLAAAGNSTRKFPWKDRVKCAMDIAEGMVFIHSEGFIHRDLKSLNGQSYVAIV
jgi:hypothetical protein